MYIIRKLVVRPIKGTTCNLKQYNLGREGKNPPHKALGLNPNEISKQSCIPLQYIHNVKIFIFLI